MGKANSEERDGIQMTEEPEEVKRLRAKNEESQINVVRKIIERPEVQEVLKKNINKQTFISGLFMAFLLIGFLEVSQAVKQIFNYTWQFDLAAGVIMIAIGAVYMVKEVVMPKQKK